MPDLKDLALQASNNAFIGAVQNTVSNLLTAFIQAKSEDEQKHALDLHRSGLQLCKKVHEANVDAINEVFQ
jgi:hypothetical protein